MFSPVASLDMILSKKRITKALIRLHGGAGWSAPLLFAKPRQVILIKEPFQRLSVVTFSARQFSNSDPVFFIGNFARFCIIYQLLLTQTTENSNKTLSPVGFELMRFNKTSFNMIPYLVGSRLNALLTLCMLGNFS